MTSAPPEPHACLARESLPTALAGLLRESDGVVGEYGIDLVWPWARVVGDNLLFRSDPDFKDLSMPFEPLLFLGEAGNGDQFAFVRTPRRDDVFVGEHEDDSRRWIGPDLGRVLRWVVDGTVEI